MSTPTVTRLPSMDHTFTISVLGKETQRIYDGTFTYSRLTLGKRLEVAKMQSKLQEDLLTLPTDVNLYVEMVSLLRYGLTESPTWWKESNYGLNLFDVNVITHIYMEVQKFETDWEKKVYIPAPTSGNVIIEAPKAQ